MFREPRVSYIVSIVMNQAHVLLALRKDNSPPFHTTMFTAGYVQGLPPVQALVTKQGKSNRLSPGQEMVIPAS